MWDEEWDDDDDDDDPIAAFLARHPGLGADPTLDDRDDYRRTNGGAHPASADEWEPWEDSFVDDDGNEID